ncbi:restriction endonuclease subunit S [Campylobacter lanienae]|uniref:restriction endonuclease subunit S n=1 Tax=Campylobacter lanienae TaxID=75658 RepID=UPI000BB44748|nr:restriction endonuclease subunit S [Campylobacter lanienae]
MMNKIPKGWEVKKLKDIGKISSGGTPSTSNDNNFGGNIAWITPADLTGYKDKFISKGKRNLSEAGLKNSSAKILPKGTILFSSRAPIGYVAIAQNEISTNQGFKNLTPNESVISEYVYYYLLGSKNLAEQSASGTTFKEISATAFSNLPIPLPPLSEQKAIADKLDDSFAKIENAITNLINAKENLKLYKQSVLKSAFNGDLLPSTSPTQRKKVKFEDVLKYEQPTKYIVKSTKYNNDFKTPVLTAGKGFILGYTNETEGIFTNTPVIIFDDFTTSSQYVNFHFKVKSSAMKILRPADNVNLKFLFYKMQTIQHKSDTHKRYWISEYAKLEIPLPPLSEQNLIVTEIDRRFAIVDKTLNLIDKSIQNAKNLKQSILKKAFSGELRSEI